MQFFDVGCSKLCANGPVDLADIITYLVLPKLGKVIPLPMQFREVVPA